MSTKIAHIFRKTALAIE